MPHHSKKRTAGILPVFATTSRSRGNWRLSALCLTVLVLSFVATCTAEILPNEVVVKVQGRGWVSRSYGSGWCLDADCDLVVTNYHVARIVGPRLAIRGVKVIQSLMATGEDDHDAQALATAIGPLKLAWVRDIALLTLAEPLAHKGVHGVPFYAGQLRPEEKVLALGYPGGKLESIPGKFLEEQEGGLLLFQLERGSSRGFSGGLIVDEQGRAVGLLFAAAEDRPRFVYAVPVWSLADFVRKTRPQLAARLFPGGLYHPDPHPEAAAADVFERGFPASSADGFSPAPALPESYLRPEQPPDTASVDLNRTSPQVVALRRSAQMTWRQMNNFVARQTLLLSDGSAWQHELQLIDGRQRFRPLHGGKDRSELPLHGVSPVPGAEWAGLLSAVGFDASLRLRFERQMRLDNRTVNEFQYQAPAGNQTCWLRIARPFHKTRKGPLACSGLIWTDDQFRILRISEHMAPPPDSGLSAFSIVVLYGWWGERLVPVETSLLSKTAAGKTFIARAKFDNYRVFTAHSKILDKGQPQLQGKLRAD